MTFVAWFEIVAGAAMIGIWALLLAARRVPELAAGDLEIRFHLAAEVLAALVLVGGGIALLADGGRTAQVLAAAGLGALGYTAINSTGYYAQRREWPPVILFAVLAAATVGAVFVLLAD
jgi:hypothetical protein